MIQQMSPGEAVWLLTVSDVARLGTVIAWGTCLYLLRDIYAQFKDLRADVHGKGGINERLARVEGAQEK